MQLRKILSVFIICVLGYVSSFGQGENNNWYFGGNIGIDFNSGPTPINGTPMNAHEGCSSISDNSGNLLFYTDGITVWDRTNAPMPNGNGLFGHNSSTMAAVIVPDPGSTDRYYVFTADVWLNGANGINYSVVDMTANGGFGDVVTKNVAMLNPACEKVTAILHENCVDWWIISHEMAPNSDDFYVWPLTAAGLGAPTIQSIGSPVQISTWSKISYLIPSWDGNQLVHNMWEYTTNSGAITELLDFDKATGTFTGVQTLTTTAQMYGACFSPNDSLIYLCQSFGGGQVFQFERFAANPSLTQTLVGTIGSNYHGSMQLGPDDIMYINRNGSNWTATITSPNTVGVGCNYVDNGFLQTGGTNDLSIPIMYHYNIRNNFNCDCDFTFTNPCFGDSTYFVMVDTTDVDSVHWNFDDIPSGANNFSNLFEPAHLFTSSGTFDVTMICYKNSTSDTMVNTVTIYEKPVAGFEWTDVCLGDSMFFTDTSSIGSGNIIDWDWDFGDGDTSLLQNPAHLFANPGTYDVTLIVLSDSGCTDTITNTVEVYELPVANFGYDAVCFDITFSDSSTVTNSVIADWQWDFGDNAGTSSAQNPSYSYTTPGNYNVKLIVTSAQGCIDSIIIPITVDPGPIAHFTFSDVCFGDSVYFTDNSSYNFGNIVNWEWNFDDASPIDTNQNPVHFYATEGTYSVTLTIYSDSGCVGDTTIDVNVFGLPTADFTANNVCLGGVTSFNDLSINPTTGIITNWDWDFGEGGTSIAQNPNYTYNDTGIFDVTLIVTSGDGCSDTIVKQVEVYPLPEIDFAADTLSGCSPVCVEFTNNTIIGSGNITTYEWNLGDGTITDDLNPSHCYTNTTLNNISFNVGLTATSDHGCVSAVTVSNMITVFPAPVAFFGADPQPTTVLNTLINFYDLSYHQVNQWGWTFYGNDGQTLIGGSNEQNPTFEFPEDTGSYPVHLEVTNIGGCVDDTIINIEIDGIFAFFIPNAFSPNGDGDNDKFFPQGIGINDENFTFYIFDRWGEVIFTSNSIEDAWDGIARAKGGTEVVQEGVYVWKIKLEEATRSSQLKHEYIGHVTLIK